MSGPSWMAIGTGALLDGGLKATALLALGLGASHLLRGQSASTRHGVHTATLLSLPALPLLAARRGPEIAVDAPWLVALWVVGALISVAPLVSGVWNLERAWRTARTAGPANSRMSPKVRTPLTYGWWSPRVLLPTCSATWDALHLDAVMAHEQAHIARRDWLVHALVWGVCAAFWFHPLAWYTRRLLLREAEHAADDLALGVSHTAADYAHTLVTLARERAPMAALAHSPSELERRVHAVLESRPRTGWGPLPFLALWGTLMAATPALAGWATWTAPESAQTCSPHSETLPWFVQAP